MSYTNPEEAKQALIQLQQKLFAYSHAMGVLYLDATTAAPRDTWEGRGKTLEVLSQASYELMTNPENEELFSYLEGNAASLDEDTLRQVRALRKAYNKNRRIPADEYVEYTVLLNDAENVWHRAKLEDDFASFAPYLEKIIAFNRRLPPTITRKCSPMTPCSTSMRRA